MMSGYGGSYLQDMSFLGRHVWPRVQSVAFCHDSFTCRKFAASHRFPVVRDGTEHLGQVVDFLAASLTVKRKRLSEYTCRLSRHVSFCLSVSVSGKCTVAKRLIGSGCV